MAIKGIFEPFKKYVKKQLDLRKKIISNSKGNKVISNKRYEKDPELFFAYAQEKQCIIRMMSGVDLRVEKPELSSVLEIDSNKPPGAHVSYDETYLRWKPSGLARQYILEGGTRYYDDKTKHGWRGGFTTGRKEDDMVKAFSYGDKNVRANPGDGFGVVPMPGITDASIQTKSDDGALREAQVNFVCFNRRQLEVLEMLYMRVGYPVCLEWGWNPFISNQETRETHNYTIKNAFFRENSTLDDLNRKIRNYKRKSSGNYDGFVGYVKNFTFKAREDGGYDCTTEIMAHGEILESLKSPVKKIHKIVANAEDPVVEYEDRFLFYLRALKHQLNSAGSQLYLSQFISEKSIENGSIDLFDGRGTVKGNIPVPPEEYQGEDLAAKQQALSNFQDQYNNQVSELSQNKTSAGGEDSNVGLSRNEILDLFNFKSVGTSPYGEVNPPNPNSQTNSNEESSVDLSNLDESNAVLSEFSPDELENLNTLIKNKGYDFTDPNAGLNVNDNTGGIHTSLVTTPGIEADGRSTDAHRLDHVRDQHQQEIDEANQRARAWNEYLKIKATELDLNIPVEYRMGLHDIKTLFKYINKETDQFSEGLFDQIAGKGFESMLGGAILKQTIQYNPYSETEEMTETIKGWKPGGFFGRGKNVDVNTTYQQVQGSTYDSGKRRNIYIRWDLLCQMLNHLSNASSDKTATRLDLLANNKTNINTINVLGLDEALTSPPLEFTYMNPNQRTWNNRKPEKGKSPLNDSNNDGIKQNNTNEGGFYIEYSPCRNTLSDPMLKVDPNTGEPIKPKELIGKYHPIIGNSLDERVCLMPHQPIFDSMFESGETHYSKPHSSDENVTEEVNLRTLSSYESSNKPKTMRNSIGFIYFNLDYLIETYEGLRLKSAKEKQRDGSFSTYATLNRDFELFSYVRAIWDGVNDACAGYYNFKLNVEHERPNVARIIDMRISTVPDDIFNFEPQGLKSITRQLYFDSTIDSDMASAISIAAQAPNSEQSLESLSFKAFHRNIKSRFLRKDFVSKVDKTTQAAISREELAKDIMEFTDAFSNLTFYLRRLHNHDFETEFRVLTPGEAIRQALKFIELRETILHRYPLFYKNGNDHKLAGQWRENTTTDKNAIIPLQCSLQMDGISGIIPLQLFKIHKDRLPLAYQREDICFVVKSESHKITNSQDWILEVTGQMALLNKNPNNSGTNNILEYVSPPLLIEALNEGPDTKWADYLRDVMDQFGHTERSYAGDANKAGEYGSPIYSGEISSHGDITPEMAAIGEVFLRCMEDEQFCNEHLYGDNPDDHIYTVDGVLSNVKLEFTGGNDKEHQKDEYYCEDGKTPDGRPCTDYGGSAHKTGNALDFIITSHAPIRIIKPINEEDYAVLENINCNYTHIVAGMGDVVPGVLDFTKPEQMPSLSKFCLEGCRSNDGMRQIADNYTSIQKALRYSRQGNLSYGGEGLPQPTNWEKTKYHFEGAKVLNALVILCSHLHKKYPNFWFIDEYRKPSGRASGLHFHIMGRYQQPPCALDQADLTQDKLTIL